MELLMGHSTILTKNGQKWAKSAKFCPKFILPSFNSQRTNAMRFNSEIKVIWGFKLTKNTLQFLIELHYNSGIYWAKRLQIVWMIAIQNWPL
jgi:hypothetical protein